MTADSVTEAWQAVVRADAEWFRARMEFFQRLRQDGTMDVLVGAIGDPHERGAVLRCMESLSPEEREVLFPSLMGQATVGHSDTARVRAALATYPSDWFERQAARMLDDLLSDADAEAYRRTAELFQAIAPALLLEVVARAGASSDPRVREVAEDFAA